MDMPPIRVLMVEDDEDDFVLTREPLPAGPVGVEAISGAFMLVRRSAIDEVGPMDEAYFLHCEDLDWCMRFRAPIQIGTA